LIAFVTTRGGATQIWTMDASGRPWEGFSRYNQYVDFDPLWSPDMVLILYSQFSGSSDNRSLLKAASWKDGGLERGFDEFSVITTSASVREPDFSPDGYWIVLVTSEVPGNIDIFIMRSTGADLQRITTDEALDFDPAWRPMTTLP
jgi:Tol biopolymer transport system component